MEAAVDQMLIWEMEGIMWKYLIPQLDNFARIDLEFGQPLF